MVLGIKEVLDTYFNNFEEIAVVTSSWAKRGFVTARDLWPHEHREKIYGNLFYKVSDEIIKEIDDIFDGHDFEEIAYGAQHGHSFDEYKKMQTFLDQAASRTFGSDHTKISRFTYTDMLYFLKEIVRRGKNIDLKKVIINDYEDILGAFRPINFSEELIEFILDYKLQHFMAREPYKKSLCKNANENQKVQLVYFFMGGK